MVKQGACTVRAGTARVGILGIALAGAGCSYVIGLNGYAVGTDAGTAADGGAKAPGADASAVDASALDASAVDAGALDGVAEAEASCTGDAGYACYACPPSTSHQLLNACSNATCVAFDASRLTKLLPDGSLPQLPPLPGDGGAE